MKKTALLLIFILLLSLVPSTHAIAAKTESNDKYIEFVRVFDLMKHYEGGDFRPEQSLSRAEAVDTILRMRNVRDLKMGLSARYEDVTESHWAFDAINVAADLAYIYPSADGNFYPDKPIAYMDFIRLLITVLGQDMYAEVSGGYPGGYMTRANALGVCDGVALSAGAEVPRNLAARLVYNTMHAQMLKQISHGSEIEYETGKKITLLSQLHGISIKTGVVTANEKTSLQNEKGLEKGCVAIDGVVYNAGLTNLEQYLGYYVEVLVKETEQSATSAIVFIENLSKNEELVIPAENINISAGDFSKTNVQYYDEDGNRRTAKVSPRADVFYNDVAYLSFEDSIYNLKNGYVKLLDNDCDGLYDFVFLYEYEDYLIKSIDYVNQKITDKFGRVLYLDLYAADARNHIIDSDGNEKQLFEIESGVVLTVFAEKNGGREPKKAVAYLSNENSGGQLTSIADEGSTVYWTIGSGTRTKVSEAFAETVNTDARFGWIVPGKSITVYYNTYGEIVYAEEFGEEPYYVILAMASPGGLNDYMQVKMAGQNGVSIYRTASVLRVNGERRNAADLVNMPEFYDGGACICQIVRCSFNADGNISEITTAQDKQSWNDASRLNKVSFTGNGVYYRARRGVGILGSRYILDDNSVVVVLNEDADSEKNMVNFTGKHTLIEGDDYNTAWLYDVDENGVVGLMLIRRSEKLGNTGTTHRAVVFDRLVNAVEPGENGRSGYFVYAMHNGSNRKFFAGDGTVVSKSDSYPKIPITELQKGDVVSFELDGSNEIIGMRIFYRPSGDAELFEQVRWGNIWSSALENDLNCNEYLAYGRVLKVNNSNFVYTAKEAMANDFDYVRNAPFTDLKLYLLENGRLRTVQSTALEEGDRVVVMGYECMFTDVLIIR